MSKKWMFISSLILLVGILWYWRESKKRTPVINQVSGISLNPKDVIWAAPDSNSIPHTDSGELIRYGKKLIRYTSKYFGPNGIVEHLSNSMNCENCHLDAGTKAWGGNFGSVFSMFPRYSDRRGAYETINQRITDCFERSMNGQAPDSNSREMKAMNAYIRWVGKDVPKGRKPRGTGLEFVAYLDRPADSERGKAIYIKKCASCHGSNGEGQPNASGQIEYPPLWGANSYNTAAGLYRLSKFTSFIRDNMPFGSDYKNEQLTNEEAWDLAAFVNSQPRPVKYFKNDWPNISTRPVDLADGPYADSFPRIQHKYGPYPPMIVKKVITK